jgi:hypothetical protein
MPIMNPITQVGPLVAVRAQSHQESCPLRLAATEVDRFVYPVHGVVSMDSKHLKGVSQQDLMSLGQLVPLLLVPWQQTW